MICLNLPIPPSVNSAYVSAKNGRRFASPALKSWKNIAGWDLNKQKPGSISGQVKVAIEIVRPKLSRRRDIDNRIKATLDLLVEHRVIEDDSKIMEVKASWSDKYDAPACRVIITPIEV